MYALTASLGTYVIVVSPILKSSIAGGVVAKQVMLVRLLQYAYLQPIITQYFIDNKSEIWLLFLIAHSKR